MAFDFRRVGSPEARKNGGWSLVPESIGALPHQHTMGDLTNVDFSCRYPLVNIQKAIENCHRKSGFTH